MAAKRAMSASRRSSSPGERGLAPKRTKDVAFDGIADSHGLPRTKVEDGIIVRCRGCDRAKACADVIDVDEVAPLQAVGHIDALAVGSFVLPVGVGRRW